MSVGGGSSSSSQKQNIDPTQMRFLRPGWKAAKDEVLRQPLEAYSGQTVAGQDPATLEGYGRALDYGRAGPAAPLTAASGYTTDVLGGKYADPNSNPYLRGTYDAAARAITDNYNRAVLPGLESRFGRAGQSMSSQYLGARRGAEDVLARNLGETAANIYGGAYNAERGFMDATAGRAAGLGATLNADQQARIDATLGVGASREGYQQSILDDLLQRFEFARDEPFTRLSRYANLIGQPTVLGRSSSSGWNASLDLSNLFGKKG